MEYFCNKGNIGIIIILLHIIILTLYIKGFACEPLWIWTKGCVKGIDSSANTLNRSNNEPYTCFKACGEQTSDIALQDSLCSCIRKLGRPISRSPSFCRPCKLNTITSCGNSLQGVWSLYAKADLQNLKQHGISPNFSGCAVTNLKNNSFYVDDCTRTDIKPICRNSFSAFTRPEANCRSTEAPWSTHSCNTGNWFDRLVDNFVGHDQLNTICYGDIYWIGLFSVDKPAVLIRSSMSTMLLESTSTTIRSFKENLESTTAVPQPTEATMSSSSALAEARASQYSSTERVLPFLYSVRKSSDYTTSTAGTVNTKSHTISATKSLSLQSITITSKPTIILSEKTSITPVTMSSPYEATSISSETISSPSMATSIPPESMSFPYEATSISSETTSSPSKATSIPPETKSIPYKATLYTTVLKSSESVHIAAYFEPTEHKLVKLSRHKKVFSTSSTTSSGVEQVTPKVNPSDAVNFPSKSGAQTESKDSDLTIVMILVGAMSAFSLVAVAILAVYVKRSVKAINMKQSRLTTLTDDRETNVNETSMDDEVDNELRRGNYNDITNMEYCSAARRADLRVQGNWPSYLMNGRSAPENEYILY